MKKLTDKQKERRAKNRRKFWALHCELTRQADVTGQRGYFFACSEYRKQSQVAYKQYKKNGGTL